MPSPSFSRTFHVRWGDMGFNAHMRNTAYLDTAVDVRLMYFAENGFPSSEFERLRLGPVVRRDELEYYREFHLLDPVAITLEIACTTGTSRQTPDRSGQGSGGWILEG